jgi:DNA polymerase III subunit alpha
MTSIEKLIEICDARLVELGLSSEYRVRMEDEVLHLERWHDYGNRDMAAELLSKMGNSPVPSNKSGSLILFLMGISSVDPIEHGIPISSATIRSGDAPDIDNDFDPRYREDIKRHIVESFGEERVCSIGSYQTYRTSSVLTDVARTLGLDIHEIRAITKKIQPLQSFEDEEGQEQKVDDMSFDDLCEHYPDLKAYLEKYPAVRRHAEVLRNQVKNMGTHAGGVIISDLNLQGRIPVLYDKPSSESRKIISAWAEAPGKSEDLSEVGLVKFDILGLNTLSVISDCMSLIEKTRGKKITREQIPIDDRESIRACSRGDLVGIFQLENPATLPVAREVALETLGDVSALTSLIRPGPRDMGMDMEYARRKHGHPYVMPDFLKRMLADTYGTVVFQEQAMSVAQKIAGLSKPESYGFVKAIAKKLKDKMASFHQKFRDGSKPLRDSGELTMEDVDAIYNLLETFAGYAFNRAHAVSYSAISTIQLWLKYHYFPEFLCALINNTDPGKKKHGSSNIMVDYINYSRRRGVAVLGPHISKSKGSFTLDNGDIRFSLGHIKYVATMANVIESFQPIVSMEDFHERVKVTSVGKTGRKTSRRPNKRQVESLIAAGAFDHLGTRNDVAAKYYGLRKGKEEYPPEKTDDEWVNMEKEVIGVCLSKEPLYKQYEELIRKNKWTAIHGISDKKKVRVFGMVENISPHTSKAGNSMYIVVLGDGLDVMKFFVFAGGMEFFRENVKIGNIGAFPLDRFDDSDTRFFDDRGNVEILKMK